MKWALILLLLIGCSQIPLIGRIINNPSQFEGQTVQLTATPAMHVVECGDSGVCTYSYYLTKDAKSAISLKDYNAKLNGRAIPLARNGKPLSCSDKEVSAGEYDNCNHNKIIKQVIDRPHKFVGKVIDIRGTYFFELA